MWQFLDKDAVKNETVSDAEDVTTTSDIHTPAEKMSEKTPLKTKSWNDAKREISIQKD